MTENGLGALVFFSSLALLFAMRWAHRSWGKAILATVFAPLVVVPMGFVAYLAIGTVLRGINSVLSFADWDLSRGTMGWISGVMTGGLILALLVHYCRDQRAVAHVETGPWLGTRYQAPEPRINQKRRLR